jgi:hypothetical protein
VTYCANPSVRVPSGVFPSRKETSIFRFSRAWVACALAAIVVGGSPAAMTAGPASIAKGDGPIFCVNYNADGDCQGSYGSMDRRPGLHTTAPRLAAYPSTASATPRRAAH